MKGLLVVFAVGVLVSVSMLGCSSMAPTASTQSVAPTGEVQLLINLGKVGALAKAAAIDLDSLTLDFTATGEASIHRVLTLSGNGQQTVNLTVDLAAGKQWTATARTYDGIRSYNYVHQGSATFSVVEGDNPTVSLTLTAQYSMLTMRINPIPDSATFIGLYQGNDRTMLWSPWDDTTFVKGTKPATDTGKLYYDWLPVSMAGPMGSPQNMQVIIRGTWNGQQVDLYWGTLSIASIVAGVDASYTFNLNWIGPSSTVGHQPISVTVGRIAMVTVDGTPIPPTIP